MKENFHVNILTTNGNELYYLVEGSSELDVYSKIVNPSDGYVKLESNGETHYLREDKIIRFRVISEKEKNELDELNAKKNAELLDNIRF